MAEDSYHIPQQSRRHKLRIGGGDLQTLLYDQPSSLSCATHVHTTTTTTTNTNVTCPSPLLSCATHTSNTHKIYDIPGSTTDVAGLSCATHATNTFLLSSATHSHTTSFTSSPLLSCAPNTSNNRLTPSPLLSCATHTNTTTTSLTPTCYRAPYTGNIVVRKPEQLALSLSSLAGTFTGTGTAPVEVVAYGGEDVDRRVDSVLRGSKFLKPVQVLLDEVCDVGFGGEFDDGGGGYYGLMMDPRLVGYSNTGTDGVRVGKSKRSRLIELLNEVYKRYKHYYQQIQAVIASFDIAAGAAPFATLDLKAMSKHFCYLNNAITDKLQATKEEYKGSYRQSVVNNMDHEPVWRPQRGLPKQAVTVLRAWLFDHFLHPYPTDTDKQMLATQTGLSRNQVSNWFINARVRLWKPMVEEVHTLETRQQPKTSHIQEKDISPPKTSLSSCTPKRTNNDYKHSDHRMMEGNNKEHMSLYDSIPTYPSRANRGVSLTLGLHQNNNATALPLSAIGSSQRFVMGGLDAQNREIISGRFLQEFGGL